MLLDAISYLKQIVETHTLATSFLAERIRSNLTPYVTRASLSMATVNPEVTLVNSSAVQPATGIWDAWHLTSQGRFLWSELERVIIPMIAFKNVGWFGASWGTAQIPDVCA